MSKRWSEMDDMELSQLECEMREDLQGLRTAATAYADRAWARSEGKQEPVKASGRGWMAWSAAGVTAALLALGAARLTHQALPSTAERAGTRTTEQVKEVSPVSDEALLQQIQSDLSSGVPVAMEPLQASSGSRAVASGVNR